MSVFSFPADGFNLGRFSKVGREGVRSIEQFCTGGCMGDVYIVKARLSNNYEKSVNQKYLKPNVVGYTSQVVINVVRVNSVLILTTKSCNVVIVLANFISNSLF